MSREGERAMLMKTHELKTLAPYWDAIDNGEKPFEVRRDDRGFQKGDILLLHRMKEDNSCYYDYPPGTPGKRRTLYMKITYILTGGQFGIQPGYVVMGLEKVDVLREDPC